MTPSKHAAWRGVIDERLRARSIHMPHKDILNVLIDLLDETEKRAFSEGQDDGAAWERHNANR